MKLAYLSIVERKVSGVEQVVGRLSHSRANHDRGLSLVDQHLHQARHLNCQQTTRQKNFDKTWRSTLAVSFVTMIR